MTNETGMRESGTRVGESATAGLFTVSVAVLTLEILQTRLFSYCLPPILVYCAVGVAFLGLGASGTLLALWRGWRSMRFAAFGALSCAAFSITLLLATPLFARVSPDLAGFTPSARHLGALAALAVPYVFAGIAITASLSASGAGVHRAYAVIEVHGFDGVAGKVSVTEPIDAYFYSQDGSAGSLAISENTLYTVEALGEYLGRLKPGGTLAILRFGNIDRAVPRAVGHR